MIITKKRLTKILVEIYENNDTCAPAGEQDFYFRCGNANALNYIAYKFGIDLTGIIQKRKNERRENEESIKG